jgi:protein-tyrosine phosphatase
MNMFLWCLAGLATSLFIIILAFRIAVRLGGRKVQSVEVSTWITHPQVDAEVTRQPGDILVIRWEAETEQVDVHAFQNPDDPGSAALVKRVTGEKEVTLTGFSPGKRTYFRLDFTGGDTDYQSLVVAERNIPLESVNNLRDIGGYRTLDGHMVRWGKVYRSGNLSRLSEGDKAYLADLGIRMVCDLRSSGRVKRTPDRLPPGAEYLHSPIYEDEFNQEVFPAILFRRHLLGDVLGSGYRNWPETGARAYGKLLGIIADLSNLPLLFHCTAGKDRAGIATAILLSLLGVPEETIIADYSLTNLEFDRLYQEFVETDRVERLGVPPSEVKIMLAANPEWIQRTLDYIRSDFGDAATYLQEAAGLSKITIQAIQGNLLVGKS